MKIPHFRWCIIALVFLAAILNYIDRQTLSILAPTIQKDLGLDERDYGNIVNIFLIAYTLSYLISGHLIDKLGTRVGMAIFVAFWSLSNMLTAASHGARSLGGFRFMLGLGEAGVWPAASKSVSEWFPARERALAIGVYTMGSTIGATIAPYVVLPLAGFAFATHLPFISDWLGEGAGWRMAFILTGAAGLLWLIPWMIFYRQPRESRFTTAQELELLETSCAAEAKAEGASLDAKAWGWKKILSSRVVWLLLVARLITDPGWYFYQFWFPKFLHSERAVPQEGLTITWIVYASAGVGSIAGGLLSGYLIKRGVAPAASRMWVMLGCALIMPVSLLIAHSAGLSATMGLAAITIVAALAWLINISSIVVDVVPKACLGTVFSVIAAGSTLGGIIMNTLVASMVSTVASDPVGFLDRAIHAVFGPILEAVQGGGYAMWFSMMAFLHLIAWVMLYVGRVHKRTVR